jgi:hypothetical protein
MKKTHAPLNLSAPDLTRHPPRSPRVRIGGYVILARALDKCRATLAGLNGEYNFRCPLDQKFFDFVGVNADAFEREVAKGKGDGEMLAWVMKRAKFQRDTHEIMQWSAAQEIDCPRNLSQRAHFNDDLHGQLAPLREDIAFWFDLHDLDDYVTFGGRP